MSDEKDYIKRLEALNGRPLQNRVDPKKEVDDVRRRLQKQRERKNASSQAPDASQKPATDSGPIVYRRDAPVSGSAAYRGRPNGPAIALEDAVSGEEMHVPGRGKAYLVSARVREIEEIRHPLCETLHECLTCTGSPLQRKLAEECGSHGILPHDLLFVDAETTGLGNSPLFLIGTMLWEDGGLVVRQYLARDYAEEAAVTSLFVDEAGRRKLLVSFNGKSFDIPYIRTRAAANGIPFRVPSSHLDLLHVARRVWGGRRLPNCKLQTLEDRICGRRRCGDIPGSEIPQAYHDFVRTSDASQIVEIMKHNMLDLVTLADLLTRLTKAG